MFAESIEEAPGELGKALKRPQRCLGPVAEGRGSPEIGCGLGLSWKRFQTKKVVPSAAGGFQRQSKTSSYINVIYPNTSFIHRLLLFHQFIYLQTGLRVTPIWSP